MSLERSPQFEEYVAISVEIPEVIDDGDSEPEPEPEPVPEPEAPEVIDTDTIAVETAVLMCGGKKEEWERGDFYVEKVGRLESEGMVGASGEIVGTDYEGEYAEQHELMLTSLRERAGEGFLKSFDIEETDEAYRLHATIAVIDGEGWITYAHFVREELKEIQETQEVSLVQTEAQLQEDTEIISIENEELPVLTESPTPISEVVEVAQVANVDREVEEDIEVVSVEVVQEVVVEMPVTEDREEAHEEVAPSLEVAPVVTAYEEPIEVLVVEESYVEVSIEAQNETQTPVVEVAALDLRQEMVPEKTTETVIPIEVQEVVVTQVFVAPAEKSEAQEVKESVAALASTEVTPVPDVVIEANQTSVEAVAPVLVEHKENREIIPDNQVEARVEETDQKEETVVEKPIEKPEAATEDIAVVVKEARKETAPERREEEVRVIPEVAIEVTNEEVVVQEHLHDALNTLFTQELFTAPVDYKVVEEGIESQVVHVEVPAPVVQATAEVLPFIARRAPAATQQAAQVEEQAPTTNSSRNGIRMRRAIAA